MFKRLARSPAIPWIGGTLIWAYMSLLARTMRWRCEGLEHLRPTWTGDRGWVLATWHSRILLMPMVKIIYGRRWAKPRMPLTLMVSNSRDGEFTNRTAKLLGLGVIRGSAANKSKNKDKRGVMAAREAMATMNRGGGVVVTIDGPKGPPEVVGIGAVKLAQQMGAPIVVYGLSAHARRLKTWDRLLFPKPFARGAMVIAEPIETSKEMDSEELRQRVEAALKAATARADELAGLPPLPAAAAPPPAPEADEDEADMDEPSSAPRGPAQTAAQPAAQTATTGAPGAALESHGS